MNIFLARRSSAQLKNQTQNAALDAFYVLKSINSWSQGVRCLDWVTRKDALALTVQWARRLDPESLAHVPASYTLPQDRASWKIAATQARSSWWIAKPSNGSNSDGIRLLTAREAMAEFEEEHVGEDDRPQTVLQQYVSRPRLIGGLKFDMRLYVLVVRRGTDPPTALLFTDGLARFATEPYTCPAGVEGPSLSSLVSSGAAPQGVVGSPASDDQQQRVLRAHLTNYSRQVQDDRGLWERALVVLRRVLGDAPSPLTATFIESADDAGSGGVDPATGKVLSHKVRNLSGVHVYR